VCVWGGGSKSIKRVQLSAIVRTTTSLPSHTRTIAHEPLQAHHTPHKQPTFTEQLPGKFTMLAVALCKQNECNNTINSKEHVNPHHSHSCDSIFNTWSSTKTFATMVRPAIFAFVAALLVGTLTVDALSCQDQAGARGARCVAVGTDCPTDYRPVFYDDPHPCKSGDRCCI